jgi:hypothetical protein
VFPLVIALGEVPGSKLDEHVLRHVRTLLGRLSQPTALGARSSVAYARAATFDAGLANAACAWRYGSSTWFGPARRCFKCGDGHVRSPAQ